VFCFAFEDFEIGSRNGLHGLGKSPSFQSQPKRADLVQSASVKQKTMRGWIGVDPDGTLAKSVAQTDVVMKIADSQKAEIFGTAVSNNQT